MVDNSNDSVFAFERFDGKSRFVFVFNMTPNFYENYEIGVNEDGIYDAYNWMVRSDYFHAKEQILAFAPLNNPQIIAIRVNADGSGERMELDAQGNVVQSASTPYVEWGKQAADFYWFSSKFSGENFRSTFYWMYCSTEALTDQEIRQVIDYNENL